ncbi:YbhB/YbcL family Raf kinase inhibitor-like protein [Zoogloeaceae bacterium G21618-S1]|nr:YbhB/YbcL family Raf kinase inhibitor-like protein [Zoogloeaceae bacterium G21618-S1]
MLARLCKTTLIGACALAAAAASAADDFTLGSPDVADGKRIAEQHVFKGFGCDGGNVSPALAWRHPPAGTQSYAVTVYDPDAPTGSGWWHWVVVNLPAQTTGLAAGAGNPQGTLPAGARQIGTDFGAPGYGGPCPPQGHGEHRYIFTVYALKTPHLDLPANATAALAGFMMRANSLGSASLTATYSR